MDFISIKISSLEDDFAPPLTPQRPNQKCEANDAKSERAKEEPTTSRQDGKGSHRNCDLKKSDGLGKPFVYTKVVLRLGLSFMGRLFDFLLLFSILRNLFFEFGFVRD